MATNRIFPAQTQRRMARESDESMQDSVVACIRSAFAGAKTSEERWLLTKLARLEMLEQLEQRRKEIVADGTMVVVTEDDESGGVRVRIRGQWEFANGGTSRLLNDLARQVKEGLTDGCPAA